MMVAAVTMGYGREREEGGEKRERKHVMAVGKNKYGQAPEAPRGQLTQAADDFKNKRVWELVVLIASKCSKIMRPRVCCRFTVSTTNQE